MKAAGFMSAEKRRFGRAYFPLNEFKGRGELLLNWHRVSYISY